ncbi:MAG TPA: head GIN domain-containing protein [Bacteroidales bacterium]|nr:head GIN domain-containing protein [Bacteroidales bacterium]
MKNKFSFFVILMILSFCTGSCLKEWIGLEGSGQVLSEERSVSGFKNIELDISADVEVIYDSLFSVEVSDYENLLEYISTEVKGDNLLIRHYPRNLNIRHSTAKLRVSMPSLNSVTMNGSGKISVMSGYNQLQSVNISGSGEISALEPFNTLSLTVDIDGSGKFLAAGKADQLNINISGSGDIDCFGLEAQRTTCHISGSGDAFVNVVRHLDVNISGSGNTVYMGNPTISSKISGSGKVKSW